MLFGAVHVADGLATDVLIEVAREFSPRIEIGGTWAHDTAQASQVVLDLSGLTRLCGDGRAMGEALLRTAADRGLRVRVAIAGTHTAARLLACAAGGPVTVVDPGTEAAALAPLLIDLLAALVHDDPVAPSHPRTLGHTLAPSHPRTLAPSHPRTLAPSHPRTLAPSHPRTLAPSHPRTLAPSHPRTLAPSHPRTFVPSPTAMLATFHRWGLRTLGEVAALPADAVAARLGQEGVRWQRLARGEDLRPLLPAVIEERFEQALDLEWPIEGLEPLSFVIGRLLEPLSAHLDRRGRGAAVLHVRLHLVTRAVHERSLQLPAPMRDACTLRTLALLDLESHPPSAAIDRVVVAVDPTPARVLQFSLLARPLPSPEQISTLMARLTALMGEGRCGSPAVVDSWEPGAFAMKAFAPADSTVIRPDTPPSHRGTEPILSHTAHGSKQTRESLDGLRASVPLWPVAVDGVSNAPIVALRRFRFPVPARVRAEQGRPVRVATDRVGMPGGGVAQCAGPWRTSGGWWVGHLQFETVQSEHLKDRDHDLLKSSHRTSSNPQMTQVWDRDEWDVTLGDGATYRVFRDRSTGAWFIEGIVD